MKQNLTRMVSRRDLLRQSACGFGLLGLTALLAEESSLCAGSKAMDPLSPKPPHFAPKAKRVIFLFMQGGPSSIDTFDPKPRLTRDDGKPLPFKRPLDLCRRRRRKSHEIALDLQALRPEWY